MNSFLQGKKSLSVPPLRPLPATLRPRELTPAPSNQPPAPTTAASHGQPTVEVVKEGDKVVRLIVVCTCGERVEIECLYPAGG
jgi:hypothetical protein